MLMNFRGGPPFGGCILMNSRGGPPILRGGSPLGTISMDQTVCIKKLWTVSHIEPDKKRTNCTNVHLHCKVHDIGRLVWNSPPKDKSPIDVHMLGTSVSQIIEF